MKLSISLPLRPEYYVMQAPATVYRGIANTVIGSEAKPNYIGSSSCMAKVAAYLRDTDPKDLDPNSLIVMYQVHGPDNEPLTPDIMNHVAVLDRTGTRLLADSNRSLGGHIDGNTYLYYVPTKAGPAISVQHAWRVTTVKDFYKKYVSPLL